MKNKPTPSGAVQASDPTLCAAYSRYSTKNQTESSIEAQREVVTAYCEKHSLQIVCEYVDPGFSASSDNRPAFQRMIADMKAASVWRTVVVYDLSRLFRNEADYFQYKSLFGDYGVRVICATEDSLFRPENDLLTLLAAYEAANFQRRCKVKTHDHMAVKASKSKFVGGIPPLGYDIDENKNYVINPDEAEIVKEIFQLFNDGYSYAEIASRLNEEGHLTKAGNPFTDKSFSDLLRQEKYVGTYTWNLRKAKKKSGNNNHARKPEEEQIRAVGTIPPIITKELYDSVQAKLSLNRQRQRTGHGRTHYVLGGMELTHCGVCGTCMVGKVTTSHGKRYFYYECPNHKNGHCPTLPIPVQHLDRLVVSILAKELITKDTVPVLNSMLKYSPGSEAQQLTNRLQSVRRKADNVAQAIARQYSPKLSDLLAAYEKEAATLEAELSRRKESTMEIPDTKDGRKAVRVALVKHLLKSKSPKTRRCFQTYVEDIRITNDDVKVILKY